jgi:hypothetical protein
MKSKSLLMVFLALALDAALARSQDSTRVDLTQVAEETRFGPAMVCHRMTAAIPEERHLELSLLIPNNKESYRVGEKLPFELTVSNSGQETVNFPTQACSQKSQIANRPGVTEACINLNFVTPEGEEDWFTGPCLCGRDDSLKELQHGSSLMIRANADLTLSDAMLLSDVYNGEKPTLILTPDVSLARQYFPTMTGSKAIDGCVEKIAAETQANSASSIQISAALREQKPRNEGK